MSGKFIVWEGIDGSGKTTQFLKAAEYLFRKSKKDFLLLTREPAYGKYGMQIRELLSSQKDPLKDAEKFLQFYFLDRKEHLQNLVLPALAQGGIILCDRFLYSTIAYQQAQGVSAERIIQMHSGLRIPDLVLLYDIPAKIAMQRASKDSSRKNLGKKFADEKFEKEDFLEKARQNYLQLPSKLPNHNIRIINASGSIEKVWEKTRKEIDELFGF